MTFTALARALRAQKGFLDRLESADKAGMDYAPGLEFAGQVGDDERHD